MKAIRRTQPKTSFLRELRLLSGDLRVEIQQQDSLAYIHFANQYDQMKSNYPAQSPYETATEYRERGMLAESQYRQYQKVLTESLFLSSPRYVLTVSKES
jgi:hypothetical protein